MAHWTELFGEQLSSSAGSVKTVEALHGKVVGIYFSAHWCPPCRGFTPVLAEAYTKALSAKGLEVVFASWDKDQKSFDEYFQTMPWKALPFAEKGKQEALSKKLKVQGIPTLVLLDAEGSVITLEGRAAVSEDLSGEDFPWKPKPFHELLGTSFTNKDGNVLGKSAVDGKVLGLYFSAHWCPPCRGFTPKLAAWYKAVSPKLSDFEIVFISSDRDEAQFKEYLADMPWIALPYEERKRKAALSNLFQVEGIPTFVIVDKDGTVITTNGRSIPSADPEGKEFPWHPKPVKNIACDTDGINESPSFVVFMDGADDATRQAVGPILESIAIQEKELAKQTGDDAILIFAGGPDAASILNRIRAMTKQSVPLRKHHHPLQKVTDRRNWNCDGCNQSGEGAAFNCSQCDFDFCEACNSKAADVALPVSGVLLNLQEGCFYLCPDLDFQDAAKVKDFLNKFRSGALEKVELE